MTSARSTVTLTALGIAVTLGCSSGTGDVADPAPDDSGLAGDTASSLDATSDGASDSTGAGDTAGDTARPDTHVGDGIVPGDAVSIDGGGVDAGPADSGSPCTFDPTSGKGSGCSGDEYCDAPTCAAGRCKPRGKETFEFAPVCGCDHVTYWNASRAKSRGVAVPSGSAGVGSCDATGSGRKCGGLASIACPESDEKCIGDQSGTGASCGASDLGGSCWSIPAGATCVGSALSLTHRVCSGGSPPLCQSFCNAVRSGSDFYRDGTCGG